MTDPGPMMGLFLIHHCQLCGAKRRFMMALYPLDTDPKEWDVAIERVVDMQWKLGQRLHRCSAVSCGKMVPIGAVVEIALEKERQEFRERQAQHG